jgi:hypothetical protein
LIGVGSVVGMRCDADEEWRWMSVLGRRRLDSWESPGYGIDGRGNLGGSG